MKSLPNPWLSDSAAILPSAVDTAVAPKTSPLAHRATAGPIESSSNQGGHQGAPAAVHPNPIPAGATDLLGSDISDVHELFMFARLLVAHAKINPAAYAPEAIAVAEEIKAQEQAYYDEPPLFLRRTG